MPDQMANTVPEHRLSVAEWLGLLVDDGLVIKPEAELLLADTRLKRQVVHPLAVIADQKWKSQRPPHRVLTLEDLTEWLAVKVGLEYYHIDPLKIDFTAVTDVMSSAYATRFGILPVQVTAREIVVVTTEPYLREWEKEIQPIIKKSIHRVVANPVDVARYLIEFYNLARSVKKATQQGGQSAGLSSFEQLVELGRSNRQFDANDQHIVNIVDWLWQYAFEQRASDIHIEPRRELGIVRFRIDGVLHQVEQNMADAPDVARHSSSTQRRLVSLYFLTPSNSIEQFRETARQIDTPERTKVLLTGPWPPFNFVVPAS